MADPLDAITISIVDTAARGDALGPAALTFLLRSYQAADRPELGETIGLALARALAEYEDEPATVARAAWLRVFAEAAAISEDERLIAAVRSLAAALVEEWPRAVLVAETSMSIEACLLAARLDDSLTLIPQAIDALERVVGAAYRPGVGVAHRVDAKPHARGGLSDHVCAASALLTAFEACGRLPYSMLAEELMRLSSEEIERERDVALTSDAARVLCRLAALHDDESYRGAAVIASDADYHDDARRLLDRAASLVDGRDVSAAIYGLALGEWRARSRAGAKTP